MMKHLMLAVVGFTLLASPAFAAKHCVDKDKKEISLPAAAEGQKRAVQCKAAGGKWVKMKKTSVTK
jgi:opacity protein-like surface antigen